jgi:rhomboid protease GluP
MTVLVLLVTAILTGLQFGFPGLLGKLQRTPATLSEGQYWRLITPLFINRGGWKGITLNFLSLTVVGVLAERFWGSKRWLLFFLAGGLTGELAGLAWKPYGAGSSVAVFGLIGALAVCLLFRTRSWVARVAGALMVLGALVLTARRNLHGPPLVFGAGLASAMVWRKRGGAVG